MWLTRPHWDTFHSKMSPFGARSVRDFLDIRICTIGQSIGKQSHKWSEAFILAHRILEIPSRSKNTSPCKIHSWEMYFIRVPRGRGESIWKVNFIWMRSVDSTCVQSNDRPGIKPCRAINRYFPRWNWLFSVSSIWLIDNAYPIRAEATFSSLPTC